MPTRPLTVLVLAVLALALAAGAARAEPRTTCEPTPIGFVCLHEDVDGDETPERVYVYPNSARPVLLLDVEERNGHLGLLVGTYVVPDSVLIVDHDSHDGDRDGSPERRVTTLHAYGPTYQGQSTTVTLTDANSDGTPERLDYWSFSPQHGETRHGVGTLLP